MAKRCSSSKWKIPKKSAIFLTKKKGIRIKINFQWSIKIRFWHWRALSRCCLTFKYILEIQLRGLEAYRRCNCCETTIQKNGNNLSKPKSNEKSLAQPCNFANWRKAFRNALDYYLGYKESIKNCTIKWLVKKNLRNSKNIDVLSPSLEFRRLFCHWK